MIQPGTVLKVADNSGARKVRCFKVLGSTAKRYANNGDLIKVSIIAAIPRGKVTKKEKYTAVVVRTKHGSRSIDGGKTRFDSNAVVLLNNQGVPFATSVSGPISRKLRGDKFKQVVSWADEVL